MNEKQQDTTVENNLKDENTLNKSVEEVMADETQTTVDETPQILDDVHVEENIVVEENFKTEEISDSSNDVVSHKIKRYIDKPMSKRDKRLRAHDAKQYEKAFERRVYKEKTKRTLRTNVVLGLLITVTVIMLFKYVFNIDMATIFEKIMTISFILTGALVVISGILLITDDTSGNGTPDPITDYFIINKGKVTASTKKRHLDRINTRFLMVTFLKLYQKQQIAIVNEKIIYGTLEDDLNKDEVALLNFMLDHNIRCIDDFIEAVTPQNSPVPRKDQLYANYKEAILEMALDKKYINQSINKAKYLLRAGAVVFAVIVIALVTKGQGTLVMLGIYGLQSIILFLLANLVYANSKGAHQRVSQLRKERKLLQSPKSEIYTSLIYNYLFGKEEKVLKRIQKQYETKQMSGQEYLKFSETYNSFNYILDYIKNEI